MNSTAAALTQRLAATPTVGIIGLGYVGLPLAVAFAESGAAVIGLDVDPRRVASVRAGQSFVEDVSTEALGRLVRAERLVATDDVAALKDADAIVICVPTPLGKSKEPDISYIVSAADAVAGVLRRGQLIVLESTTYPGTTQEILQPRFEARGLKAGEDFFLAFSPERIDPGNQRYTLKDIPKVVGGLTPACRELATTLYARITRQVVPVSGPQTAEMVKLFENTFRSVNIALVNEFAIMCRRLGISVWEVIGAAATKPFGFMPFYPGPGLGGHCLPSDPHYLSWRLRLEGYEPRFIAFADEINRRMPTYVVQLVADALNDRGRAVRGARILVLGVAYKANVADTRDSPAIEIIQSLLAKGAAVAYHGPFVPSLTLDRATLDSVAWRDADLAGRDVVLILTPHAGYDWGAIVREAPLVVDTRNATADVPPAPHVIRL
ncbi:MAG: UDP-N-acetyl-D-glucosamine dehydrogenase [Candidatus Rokuibacteriota bacterium]|nr:MAG: UDP-N-acetyl-D-glucosamine dehydrogenase [Candidatus Rokubacteria bacterium]